MRVTIKHIAIATGLSESTVNHVLKNRAGFRVETKERVLASAKRLGYRPNFFAQGVRSGKFNSVGLLLSEKISRFFLPNEMLGSLHDALAEAHMSLMVTRLPDRALTDHGVVPKVLQQCMVDGLLIDYIANFPAGMIELIHRYRLPVVWINSRQKANAIYPDDLAAGSQAARHLLTLGHRRIAYASIVTWHYSLEDRRKGIAAAMRGTGCGPQVWAAPDPNFRDLPAFYGRKLRGRNRPTAVIAYSLSQAMTIYLAAAKVGLRIPEDLSIVTFNDEPDKDLGITTLLIPVAAMGRGAVEMILRRIAKPDTNLKPVALPFGFDAGRTCGPPPTTA